MADRDRPTRAGLTHASRVRLRFAADDRLVSLVRRGDASAFEILYDRHVRELLSFCRYMLGSQADAEDAVQSTFVSAHRALLADDRWVDVRPWLFTIARNACLSILRTRRPLIEISGESPSSDDPVGEVEQREEMRHVLATLRELPESQRVALVLSELHGFSQSEIGALLGVRAEQVKSYVYQARSNLISDREARGADCHAIREELATARGPALLKSRLRRHIRACPNCQRYAAQLSHQRSQLSSFLPAIPSLALKRRALEAALGEVPGTSTCAGATLVSGSAAAATAELAGGTTKALVAKLLTAAALLGVGTGATTVTHSAPVTHPMPLTDPIGSVQTPRGRPARSTVAVVPPLASVQTSRPLVGVLDRQASSPPTLLQRASTPQGAATNEAPVGNATIVAALAGYRSEESHGNSEQVHAKHEPQGVSKESVGRGKSEESHGNSDEPVGNSREPVRRGKSEEPHGNSEEPVGHGHSEEPHASNEELLGHGKSEEPHGKSEEPHGKSEEPHGKSEEPHGKSEEPHGKSEESIGHGKSEEAVGPDASKEPHGSSDETPAGGKSEESHGNSEQAHVADEQAPAHGNSYEPHGKATG